MHQSRTSKDPPIRTAKVWVKGVTYRNSLAIIQAAHGPVFFAKRTDIFDSVAKTLLEPGAWVELECVAAGMYHVVISVAGRKIGDFRYGVRNNDTETPTYSPT